MEVKTRLIFTSNRPEPLTAFERVLIYVGVLAVALAFAVGRSEAADAPPCDGQHYVWKFAGSGGFNVFVSTFSTDEYEVSYALVGKFMQAWPVGSSGGYGSPQGCGLGGGQVTTGTVCTVGWSSGGTFNYTATKVCSPHEAGTVPDYEQNDVLVMVGSFLAFCIGWCAGQQR